MKQDGRIRSLTITTATWFPASTILAGTLSTISPGSTAITGIGTSFIGIVTDNSHWLVNASNNEAQLIIRVYDDTHLDLEKPFLVDLNGASCVIVPQHKLRSLRVIPLSAAVSTRSAIQPIAENASSPTGVAWESGDVEGGMVPILVMPGNGGANVREVI